MTSPAPPHEKPFAEVLEHYKLHVSILKRGYEQEKYRIAQQLTQEALAFTSGLDRTYISLLELGRRSPTLNTLVVLSNALGVTLTSLLAGIKGAEEAGSDA